MTDPLCLVFVPALVALLLNAENTKGRPLTEAEVLAECAPLAEALDRNAHVWVSFKSLLSLEGCSLTGEVRDNVVTLADFVLGNTAKGAENLSDETIRTFINVNLQISEGLLEGDKAG